MIKPKLFILQVSDPHPKAVGGVSQDHTWLVSGLGLSPGRGTRAGPIHCSPVMQARFLPLCKHRCREPSRAEQRNAFCSHKATEGQQHMA